MQAAASASPTMHKQFSDLMALPNAEMKVDGNESDSEVRKVPDLPGGKIVTALPEQDTAASNSRKRGAVPADKEHKRLKRLLRNRVSAQQARERKKAYVVELEAKARDLELRNAELEERVNTLQKETFMLRQILKNIKNNGSTAGLEQAQ
ncbi:transcription factor HY5 isoform X2 [Selaginella moellendorffii]|uniref:transcription factor HY5 isoform X2 n=1 Tax=Selaginella moellendorffii TaxID=88036 RepID=UPI000D1CEA9F|nr:transcription factor HY5 isoform X2 [Selaginella moellendorffii]XP_024537317.1 transcription factor HY5 isoform X2 [Selaginella moellendorffii]|eukprot:XP_024533940.1 transcription factor HY5 isoform X2 [Selaginella moellendorffii]